MTFFIGNPFVTKKLTEYSTQVCKNGKKGNLWRFWMVLKWPTWSFRINLLPFRTFLFWILFLREVPSWLLFLYKLVLKNQIGPLSFNCNLQLYLFFSFQIRAAAELALSVLPHAASLNQNEIQRGIQQCKEESDSMLEKACDAVEKVSKSGHKWASVTYLAGKKSEFIYFVKLL